MKNKKKKLYSEEHIIFKLYLFCYWKIKDLYRLIKYGRDFNEYGVTMYCGRQGAGKTMAMVEYLERMRKRYPKAIIITNFGYIHEHHAMESWQDLLHFRNGINGVIFAIDEIQNEFSNAKWKNFPEFILREITQQRKQKVKIACTSQIFTRVVKQLREQTFEVVDCITVLGRWTFTKAFDADDYNAVVDDPLKKQKLKRLWRKNFIQDNRIRELYNSYDKIEKLKETEFINRDERVYQ